jgi:hypothetical protein
MAVSLAIKSSISRVLLSTLVFSEFIELSYVDYLVLDVAISVFSVATSLFSILISLVKVPTLVF